MCPRISYRGSWREGTLRLKSITAFANRTVQIARSRVASRQVARFSLHNAKTLSLSLSLFTFLPEIDDYRTVCAARNPARVELATCSGRCSGGRLTTPTPTPTPLPLPPPPPFLHRRHRRHHRHRRRRHHRRCLLSRVARVAPASRLRPLGSIQPITCLAHA